MGLPATIRVDQGTEFVSRDLDLWAYQRGVNVHTGRIGQMLHQRILLCCTNSNGAA